MSTTFENPPLTDPGAPARLWPPNRRKIFEPMVLAVGASPMKELVGASALREALSFTFGEMTRTQGAVHLAPLWNMLKQQPGFTEELAAPAMARFKAFELSLGFNVELPPDLASLDGPALDAAAARAPVSSLQLLEALDPPRTSSPKLKPVVDAPPKRAKSSLLVRVAVPLVLAAISMVVTPLIMNNLEEQTLEPKALTARMPLRTVRVLGDALELTLIDDDWIKATKDRGAILEEVFANAQKLMETRSIVVLDSKGTLRASAIMVEGTLRTSFVD